MSAFEINGPTNIENVEDAPDTPGLYVWYGRLSVGPADWDESITESNADAKSQLLKALRAHTIKHRQQPLQLNATANFTTRWTGDLPPALPDNWNDDGTGTWASDGENLLAKITSTNETRKKLLTLLDSSFPLFCSPLYIGLAIEQSLRSRLGRHRSQLLRHWENLNRNPDYTIRITHPANFADRAIKLGFSPEDLYCYTIHLGGAEESENLNENANLLRSAEWLLNRWANPILGRT